MAYDEVIDQVACPSCNESFDLRAQIQFGYCRGHLLRRGDEIVWCDPPGRVAPLVDCERNSGGEILVPGASDESCPRCGTALPSAHVLIRDNTIAGVVFTRENANKVVHLSPPTRWFKSWSLRRAAERNEDRLQVSCSGQRWTIAIADGAGGISGGAVAASAAVEAAAAFGIEAARTPTEWCAFLRELDQSLATDRRAGETTIVVAQVINGAVHGASVGDSRAWLIERGQSTDLTNSQRRKPLLGSGMTEPVAFAPRDIKGRLLVATDGLFNYASPETIVNAALDAPLEQAAAALVNRVRLPAGALQDDIALVLGEWAA